MIKKITFLTAIALCLTFILQVAESAELPSSTNTNLRLLSDSDSNSKGYSYKASSSCGGEGEKPCSGWVIGAIIGGVCLCLAICITVPLVIFCCPICCCRKKKSSLNSGAHQAV